MYSFSILSLTHSIYHLSTIHRFPSLLLVQRQISPLSERFPRLKGIVFVQYFVIVYNLLAHHNQFSFLLLLLPLSVLFGYCRYELAAKLECHFVELSVILSDSIEGIFKDLIRDIQILRRQPSENGMYTDI